MIFMLIPLTAGCANNKEIDNEHSTNDINSQQTDDFDTEKLSLLKKELPQIVIDGSTSTIPLEAGIRSALLDISAEDAEAQVKHNSTYGSFYNLLEGKCDIIFTVPLSQNQYDQAAQQGIELETTPIATEGFVFVVNADNPVDSLTQQQVKDIYSGKITNWKQVGGNDEEIVAYQRNNTSGSQNYMVAFMKDLELMEPKTETIPATMSGLMDSIASYDNSTNAIGYSVYSYAAEMYIAASKVKFLKIDDVAPNTSSMADGSYPLLSYNYAVINAHEPADSPVRTLIEWIVSDKGQKAVADAKYIPVANIKSSLEADIIEPLLSKGTGEEKPQNYKEPNTYYETRYFLNEDYDYESKKYKTCKIEGLKNTNLQNEINEFIADSIKKVEAQIDEANLYAKKSFEYGDFYDTRVETECINGYLSVVVSLTYGEAIQDSATHYYNPISAVWDLYTGKKLSFTDMFWKNEDFVSTVNNGIAKILNEPYNSWGITYDLLGDFWALPNDFYTFSLTKVYFPSNKGVFKDGIGVNYSSYCKDSLVTMQLRDMKDIWKDNELPIRNYHKYAFFEADIGTDYNLGAFWLIDSKKSGISEEVCKKINDYMKKAVKDNLSTSVLDSHLGKDNYQAICIDNDITFTTFDRAYILYYGSIPISQEKEDKEINIDISTVFDYYTGEVLTCDDILKQGWRNEVEWKKEEHINLDDSNVKLTYFTDYTLDNGKRVGIEIYIYNTVTEKSSSFHVPIKYFKYK